jgi:UDP:flavonoid glycosyltransferase YjiC (YdhE family)
VRIAYFVHGNGRGHAIRARSLMPALRAGGHTVHVYAGGDAVEMIRDLGGVEIDAFAPGPGLARRFAARFLADRGRLRALRPDVVVTDSDAPSLHAAVFARIPSIAIGHGLLLAHCRLPISLPFHERIRGAVNAGSASWLAHRVIVVHFGPLVPFDPRAIVARPDPRPELFEGDTRRTDSLVVYGGPADLSAYVRELHARGHRLVVFGRAADLPQGMVVEALDVGRFAAALRACRGVVGTAGSNLIAEAGALGRPVLALAPSHMIEQQVNARLAENDGFAIAAAAEEVDVRAIERFEALLVRGVPEMKLQTPTVTEALLTCLAELERL